MSHNLTEYVVFTTPITVPDNGDPAEVHTPLNELALQGLTNRDAYLNGQIVNHAGRLTTAEGTLAAQATTLAAHTTSINGLASQVPYGNLLGGGRMSSVGGSNLRLSRISNLILGSRGWFTDGAPIVAHGETSVTLPALTPNTWYYVYATVTNNAIAYVVNTTQPEDTLIYQQNDPWRRYLGCFVTNHVGQVIPFMMARGRYVYRISINVGVGAGATRMLEDATASGTNAMTSYNGSAMQAKLVPPHVRIVDLWWRFHNSATDADANFSLRSENDSGPEGNFWCSIGCATPNGIWAMHAGSACMDIGSGQAVKYSINGAGAKLSLWVAGFQEG